jgi:hypothetical protein
VYLKPREWECEVRPSFFLLRPPASESEEGVMKRAVGVIGILAAALLLAVLAGCCTVKQLKLADVYVSYETRDDGITPGVFFPPTKVKKLVLDPDKAVLYYEDSRGEFVPTDTKKMKWFRWSTTPE